MRKLLIVFLLSFSSSLLAAPWVDLSHDFDESTLYWPTSDPFSLKSVFFGLTTQGYFYSANNYAAAEHGGTHIDAPIHFAKAHQTVGQIPLDKLMGLTYIIDVSALSAKNKDYLIGLTDLQNFEKQNGRILDNSIILFRTDFSRFWPNAKKYLGTNKRGLEAVPLLHFPGLSPELAQFLIEQRHIKSVGIDTASIDFGQSLTFMSHRILSAQDVPIFENLANLADLKQNKVCLIALPMKIKKGSGAPLRVIATTDLKFCVKE